MKFHCEKNILLGAVSTAARAAATRNAQPSTEGLLFTVEDSITITGFNLEIGIVTNCLADIEKSGSVIMPNKMLQDILRKMPDDMITFIADEQNTITITCGHISFTIPGLNADEFPKIPQNESDKTFSFSQAILRKLLTQVTYAASDNESRIINTGTLFDIKGDELKLVALDGFRLAIRTSKVTSNGEDFSFIVPGAALRELEKILSEDDNSQVTIELGQRHIRFMLGHAVLFSRLLEGEFHDYQRAIPTEYKYSITVNPRELQTTVDRVSLVLVEKIRTAVKMILHNDHILLSCQTPLGNSSDVVSIKDGSEGLEIGFNNKYIIDALRVIDDEEVTLNFNGPLNPCVILPKGEGNYLSMILPTRMSDA